VTYLVDLIAHSYWVRNSIRDLIRKIHLFSDRVHSLVDLVHVTDCQLGSRNSGQRIDVQTRVNAFESF